MHTHTEPRGCAHQVVDADAVPALHDGQEGDEGGNDPAAANHQSHSHGRHLVAVDQGLTADGVVPAHKPLGMKAKTGKADTLALKCKLVCKSWPGL